MKRFSVFFVLVLFAITLFAALPVLAQQETVMDVHVDKTVAIPGHILRPGNYVFRLVDTSTYPPYVQITRSKGQDLGFLPVYPAWRPQADGTELAVSKPDQAGLEHVKAWYFPGEKYGYEFLYSKRDVRNADLLAESMHKKSTAGM
ncbi:MAG: hypothetical protein ROO76_04585 [Terriglobia bacterium]|nr:hypothetical protein [Terriglobia bacterium]